MYPLTATCHVRSCRVLTDQLMGYRILAAEAGLSPPLFADPAYAQSSTWVISSSQLPLKYRLALANPRVCPYCPRLDYVRLSFSSLLQSCSVSRLIPGPRRSCALAPSSLPAMVSATPSIGLCMHHSD